MSLGGCFITHLPRRLDEWRGFYHGPYRAAAGPHRIAPGKCGLRLPVASVIVTSVADPRYKSIRATTHEVGHSVGRRHWSLRPRVEALPDSVSVDRLHLGGDRVGDRNQGAIPGAAAPRGRRLGVLRSRPGRGFVRRHREQPAPARPDHGPISEQAGSPARLETGTVAGLPGDREGHRWRTHLRRRVFD